MLGKVYHTMSAVEQKLQRMTGISWLPEVRPIHARILEYLDSQMHAAAYALDPEFRLVVK